MENNFKKVYQFKLSMKYITPQIWRRIQVPESYTFQDLHNAIQAVMSWEDYHLHEFEIQNPKTAVLERIAPEDEDQEVFDNMPLISEKKAKISKYFTLENKVALYTYDFGDDWQVNVRLEKILPRKEGIEYPICLAGKRAAIPEDTGGVYGYEAMLEVLKDPEHEEYEDTVEWLGEDFDPEYFDPEDISF